MVFPARVADGDHGVWQQTLEEVCTDLECAGSAERLGSHHPALGNQRRIFAEQQLLYGGVVGGDAFDRQVAAGRVGSDARLLGLDHGA